MAARARPPRRLADDETLVTYPTDAVRSEDGERWMLPVRAHVFEMEETSNVRAAIIDAFGRSLGLSDAEIAEPLFRERARMFLVDNERGKRLGATIGKAAPTALPPTGANGVTESIIGLAESDVPALVAEGVVTPGNPPSARWVHVSVAAPGDAEHVVKAAVRLVPQVGVSVISDIDDTIKFSDVTKREELLRNTFTRPHRAIDGMAVAYQAWERQGAVFHYVTASPWQLHDSLTEWLARDGFPRGVLRMKEFRWKDASFFDLFADPFTWKLPVVDAILRAYPSRTFILVGDSGERDPEVYGELARRYPERVHHIFIREATSEPTPASRWAEAFRGVPADRWSVFSDPTALASAALPAASPASAPPAPASP